MSVRARDIRSLVLGDMCVQAMPMAAMAALARIGHPISNDRNFSALANAAAMLLSALALAVARQSGWEHSDNQDGHFGGRGERIFVAAR